MVIRINLNNNRGFTIIETTIVILFFVIIAFFLSYLATYQYWIYNNETAELGIANDARTALDDIDNYVRQSNRVLSSYSSYVTGNQVLILQIQSINSSNQLIPGTYDMVVYYLSSNDLLRQVFPNPSSSRLSVTKKLASGVDINNFTFSYNNLDYSLVTQVTTSLSITQTVGGQTRSITISSQAKLRNY